MNYKSNKCDSCEYCLNDVFVDPCRACVWKFSGVGYKDYYRKSDCISGVDSGSKYKLNDEPIITNVVCDENGIVTEVTLCQNSKGRKYKLLTESEE